MEQLTPFEFLRTYASSSVNKNRFNRTSIHLALAHVETLKHEYVLCPIYKDTIPDVEIAINGKRQRNESALEAGNRETYEETGLFLSRPAMNIIHSSYFRHVISCPISQAMVPNQFMKSSLRYYGRDVDSKKRVSVYISGTCQDIHSWVKFLSRRTLKPPPHSPEYETMLGFAFVPVSIIKTWIE